MPIDTRPQLSRSGALFDPNVDDQISHMDFQPMKTTGTDEENDSGVHQSNHEMFDRMITKNKFEFELQRLSQTIQNEQPMDDPMANALMQQLNEIIEVIEESVDNNEHNNESEMSSITTGTYPYPLVNQYGLIADHDRPYADYGHLGMFLFNRQYLGSCHFSICVDAQTIAREFVFDFNCTAPEQNGSSCKSIRMASKSWAITSWTDVSSMSYFSKHSRSKYHFLLYCG